MKKDYLSKLFSKGLGPYTYQDAKGREHIGTNWVQENVGIGTYNYSTEVVKDTVSGAKIKDKWQHNITCGESWFAPDGLAQCTFKGSTKPDGTDKNSLMCTVGVVGTPCVVKGKFSETNNKSETSKEKSYNDHKPSSSSCKDVSYGEDKKENKFESSSHRYDNYKNFIYEPKKTQETSS